MKYNQSDSVVKSGIVAMFKFALILFFVNVGGWTSWNSIAQAQNSFGQNSFGQNSFGQNSFGLGLGQQGGDGEKVALTASIRPLPGSQRAVLEVTASIAAGNYIYSMDQKPGLPSKIAVPESANYKMLGPFVADRKPLIKDPDPVLNYRTESFKSQVVWRAALEFTDGVDISKQSIELKYSGLICEDTGSCIPINNRAFTAQAGSPVSEIDAGLIAETTGAGTTDIGEAGSSIVKMSAVASLSNETSIDNGIVMVSGSISHSSLQPGDTASIVLSANVAFGNHTYPYLPPHVAAEGPYSPSYMGVLDVSPTTLNLADFRFEPPQADQDPHDHFSDDATEAVPALDGVVNWEIKFRVPASLPAGEYRVTGVMQSQTCDEVSCQPPISFAWQVPLKIGPTTVAEKTPAVWSQIRMSVSSLLTDTEKAETFINSLREGLPSSVAPDTKETAGPLVGPGLLDISSLRPDVAFDATALSVPLIIVISLFGGFVLNFMPCVLPVIGLKILSLVEQAGESRLQALKYNGTYVLGMLSVFWILAALILFNQIAGWGGQFSSTLFTIVFAGVVFAMALSYLEVWEIVLPSSVGQHSARLEKKEGLAGTFFKGGITTILATPCSGPGLATALAWCVGKPPEYVFLVFTCLGLGMGLPYLAVALHPPIISFLPKPGPWMVTFKQVMGFVLLGTVAFFLSYIELPYLFPTICFLMVIWFGCWLVGRLSFLSTTKVWLGTWAAAIAVIMLGSHLIFGWRLPEASNTYVDKHILKFDWNANLANEWNLYDSQTYRINTFVDRQVAYRQTQAKVESLGHTVDWQPFSLKDLQQRLHGEKPETILIDFTAEWCANCKVFERLVLHSSDVLARISSEHVTTIVADNTFGDPDITAMLEQLTGTIALPVYAIFSKDRPNHPIILDGSTISIANVLAALDKAGVPSANQIKAARQPQVTVPTETVPQLTEPLPSNPFASNPFASNANDSSQSNSVGGEAVEAEPAEKIADVQIDWKPFAPQELHTKIPGENSRLIFVKFTADWDATAKVFERMVLEHSEILPRIASQSVTAMIADGTHDNPEAEELLKELTGTIATPVYAIFTTDGAFDPIVLDGSTISVANVKKALDDAGVPSLEHIKAATKSQVVATTSDPAPVATQTAATQ